MKKALLSCFLLTVSGIVFAQDPNDVKHGSFAGRITARLDVCNSFNHAGNYYISNAFFSNGVSGTTNANTVSNVTSFDYKKASYGAGFGLNAGVGYMFNDHLGVDLGVNFGVAPKKYTDTYILTTA